MKKLLMLLTFLLGLISTISAAHPQSLRQLAKKEPLCLIIDISKQKLYVFQYGQFDTSYIVSTATKGSGQNYGSNKTPLGLHRISDKIGNSASPGTIFKGGRAIGQWDENDYSEEDLILTRILKLDGLEKGYNKGRNASGKLVDSFQRGIFIHGTNQEDLLGTPSSHGCIRMETEDLIELFNKTPIGTKVWVVE
ncbi:MAG: L,D-transpeptidase [Chlamydiota bacterium]